MTHRILVIALKILLTAKQLTHNCFEEALQLLVTGWEHPKRSFLGDVKKS